MTNRLTLFAILSAAVAFGQGAGMKQLKSVTGAEYVCTTNAVTVTQTAVTNEAALRRIGDLAGSNYVDEVAANITAGAVSYAAYANYASNVVNASVANYAQVAGLATNAITVIGPQSNLIATALQVESDTLASVAARGDFDGTETIRPRSVEPPYDEESGYSAIFNSAGVSVWDTDFNTRVAPFGFFHYFTTGTVTVVQQWRLDPLKSRPGGFYSFAATSDVAPKLDRSGGTSTNQTLVNGNVSGDTLIGAVAVTNAILDNQQFTSTLYGWRSVPSDIAGAFTLSNGLPTTPLATVTNLSTTNGAYVARFVTGQPRFTRISQGTVNVHMHHRKGAVGAATLRPELYILDSLGNKLWEYDAAQVSEPLTTDLTDSTIPVPIPSNIVLQASWRIGIYIKAFVTIATPDIYLDLEDNLNFIVSVPTPSVEYVTQSQLSVYPTFPQVSNIVQAAAGGVTVASHGVVLGDSTIAAYAGGTEVASLLVTAGDKLAGNSVVSLAVPGHTIAQQYTAWTNYTGRATSVWVAVQVGLNDMLPAANITNVVADYQALINRIRTDAPSAKILVATMTPAKQRYIDLNGSASGLLAYTWWRFLNTSIMGGGTRPVTNVDMRVSSHTDVLNDGAGNLASVYDTGDHVHENTAGRTVIAAEWRRALNVAGLLPASAPTWYRDAHMESNIVVSSVSAVNGSATRLAVDDGVSFEENGVRLVAGWTNGVPVLAVNIAGSNYVFELHPADVVTPDTFVPTDLAGLALWHDGADASSMTLSNNFVAVWNDKSPNGYHSVQSVLSARGIVSNGVPYFSDYTKGMPLTNAIIQQPFTMFLVAAQTVDAGNLRIIQGASGYDSIFAFRRTTANGVKLGGTQIYNGSLTTNAANHVGCLAATGGVASLFFDGAKVAEVAAANPFGRAVIGGPNGNLTFDEARAFVCEIVVYDRFLSQQERTLVQRALGKKWGVGLRDY